MGFIEGRRRGGIIVTAHGVQGIHKSGRGLHGLGRAAGGGRPSRRRPHAFRLLIFLIFHPPVLEPDLDLPLAEVQQVGHLHAAGPAQVAVEVEFLLQLHQLSAGVGCAGSLGGRGAWRAFLAAAGFCWPRNEIKDNYLHAEIECIVS